MTVARWPNRHANDGFFRWAYSGAPHPYNCSFKRPPCCGRGSVAPCELCNASTLVGCDGFSFTTAIADTDRAARPPNLRRWAAEVANGDAWLHGYWAYDFSDRYYPLRAVENVSDHGAALLLGTTPKNAAKADARFYGARSFSQCRWHCHAPYRSFCGRAQRSTS